jgi:septal ring factor EnvC (AmiA/AmiB activator)
MWSGIIKIVIVLALIAGGIWFINHLLSNKDVIIASDTATITSLQQKIAADLLDINNLTESNASLEAEILGLKADAQAASAQAARIQKKNNTINQDQSTFEGKVNALDLSVPANVILLNQYEACIAKDISDPSCITLLK